MDDADLGTLVKRDDVWRLTFTRRLPHPPDKVWRAVTEPEHLATWFPDKIVGDRRAGASLGSLTRWPVPSRPRGASAGARCSRSTSSASAPTPPPSAPPAGWDDAAP
jgi:hypothetical protein